MALAVDKENMSICGSYNPDDSISVDKLLGTKIKVYPVDPNAHLALRKDKRACFGSRSIKDIIEFTTPSDFSGKKVTEVKFSYEIELNDLAPKIGVDGSLIKAYRNPLVGEAVLSETNNGWHVEKIKWLKNKATGTMIFSEKYARQLYAKGSCVKCQDLIRDGITGDSYFSGMGNDRIHAICNQSKKTCARYGLTW